MPFRSHTITDPRGPRRPIPGTQPFSFRAAIWPSQTASSASFSALANGSRSAEHRHPNFGLAQHWSKVSAA